MTDATAKLYMENFKENIVIVWKLKTRVKQPAVTQEDDDYRSAGSKALSTTTSDACRQIILSS